MAAPIGSLHFWVDGGGGLRMQMGETNVHKCSTNQTNAAMEESDARVADGKRQTINTFETIG